MKKIIFPIKMSLIVLTFGVFLSGCDDPKGRSAIRLGAINFRDKATSAIESVKIVYKQKTPKSSKQEVIEELLTNPKDLETKDVEDLLIKEILTPDNSNTGVNKVLDELKYEYVVLASMFDNLEKVGTVGEFAGGGRQALSDAVKPTIHLSVRMLKLAQLISENPPKPNELDRTILVDSLNDLRSQYNAPKLNKQSKQEIVIKAEKIIDDLIRNDSQEKALLCDAYTKLVLAADTGIRLTNLLRDYNSTDIDQVITKLEGILVAASYWKAGNYTEVVKKLEAIKAEIEKNPDVKDEVNKFLKELSSSGSMPASDLYKYPTNGLNCSSGVK